MSEPGKPLRKASARRAKPPPADKPEPSEGPHASGFALAPLDPDLAELAQTSRRPAVRRPARQITRGRSGIRQMSLFGADARRPETADLSGLLAGPGQVVRMGGTARVSIVVDDPWRAAVLIAELGRRKLHATCVDLRARRAPVRELTPITDPEAAEDLDVAAPPRRRAPIEPPPPEDEAPAGEEPAYEVRTAYSTILVALATGWLDGTTKRPPAGLLLDGRALRLWVVAAGRVESPSTYLLGLGRGDAGAWPAVGAALAAVGLKAELTGVPGARPGYRIVGQRRVARLAELVGEPPTQAPPELWPS